MVREPWSKPSGNAELRALGGDLRVALLDRLLGGAGRLGPNRIIIEAIFRTQLVFEVRQQLRQRADLLLLFATYWECVPAGYERPKDFVQSDMGHACEWETSMILRIAPQLVANPQAVPDVSSGYGFEPAYRGWTTKDRTAPGHIGAPRHATAEKGEHLFQTFANGVVEYLDRVRAWDGGTW